MTPERIQELRRVWNDSKRCNLLPHSLAEVNEMLNEIERLTEQLEHARKASRPRWAESLDDQLDRAIDLDDERDRRKDLP